MEKKHSPSSRLYWYELTEDEWYSATQDTRTQLTVDLENDAFAAGYRHANIMVTPDAVMSISPRPYRHSVYNWNWQHKPNETAEHKFSKAISKAIFEADIPNDRIKAILQTYVDSYK